jgi:phosphatidylglycerol:prolipoprotein diacylglycerol transferase
MLPKLFDIPILGIPINSYGAAIMIGFLLATYVAVRRLRKLPWTLDLEKAGNRALVADDLLRRGKIKESELKDDDPGDLARLSCSDLSKNESIQAVIDRKNSDFILDLAIISMIFGLIGGKIIYILQYPDRIADSFGAFNIFDGRLHPMGTFAGLIPPIGFLWIKRHRRLTIKNPKKTFAWVGALTLLFALAGARAMYIYNEPKEFNLDAFRSWQSGFVLYGGLILGFVGGVVYGFIRKRPILLHADIVAPSILLGIAFGRIGCFLNGCCFGKTTEFFLGVPYPRDTPPYNKQLQDKAIDFDWTWSKPVHAVQLYEAAAMIALFFVLSKLWQKNPKPGIVITLTGLAYAVWRFLIEFMRNDDRPTVFWGLSFSQGVSLAVALVCGVLLFVFQKRERKEVELVA